METVHKLRIFRSRPSGIKKSGASLSAALSFLISLFHGFDQCMSKLIGTGGLLVTTGIAEQDIRRFLCAAAFEELSDRCQIARAAALKMKVMNETIFKVKGNFSPFKITLTIPLYCTGEWGSVQEKEAE